MRKVLGVLTVVLLLAALSWAEIWDGTADTSWHNSMASEFTITTAEELAGLALLVNEGNSFSSKKIKLGADIRLNDTTNWQEDLKWTAIGTDSNPFQGTFDGNGHIISGIYINSNSPHQGFFGYIGSSSTIINIGLTVSVKGGKHVGALAGQNTGIISFCYAIGSVEGEAQVGGLVGSNIGNVITNSYSMASVKGDTLIGGIVGYNGGIISHVYATGNVNGKAFFGGLVGNEATIASSYYSGLINERTGTGSNTRTALQMQSQSNYAGWDFINTWGIHPSVNNAMPYLQLAPPKIDSSMFIKVTDIRTLFPYFVPKGYKIAFGKEKVMPVIATNKIAEWAVNNKKLENDTVTFDEIGIYKITAAIKGGLCENIDDELCEYTTDRYISVYVPFKYSVILNASQTSYHEAGDLVTKIAIAPDGKEFERWKITSRNKPVILDSVDLYKDTLHFTMPKMNLEITTLFKDKAANPKYEVLISDGKIAGDNTSFEAGEPVTVYADEPPDSLVFGYWNVFPTGAIDYAERRNANLSFAMPETDITLKAVFLQKTVRGDSIIEIVNPLENTNVDDWVPTATEDAEIEATTKDGLVTITAIVFKDGFAAFETDISPNTMGNVMIEVGYVTDGTWRLYLDIPGVPYAEGYFVELKPCGEEEGDECEEYEQPQAMWARIYHSGDEINLRSITRTFTLADFKNELGDIISAAEAEKATGMSFAKFGAEPEESTISIISLRIYMSELNASDGDSSSSGNGGSSSSGACISFDQIVKTRWGNTLTVINNPVNNGGYNFTEFTWFRDGVKIGEGQSWSAGTNGSTIPTGTYIVEMKASESTLRSCDKYIDIPPEETSVELRKDGASEIYDIKGRRVINPTGNRVLIQKNKNGTGGKLP
jgi:hypothetical protein